MDWGGMLDSVHMGAKETYCQKGEEKDRCRGREETSKKSQRGAWSDLITAFRKKRKRKA